MKKQAREKARLHRKRRVRAKISGTATRPRLTVFRSLRNISVQVVDDVTRRTLASASLAEVGKAAKNTVEGAEKVGQLIAKKCAELKIQEAVFDRSGYRYHGRVKAVAEGARSAGLML
jgi:large subunit ribosomal protein L18